MIHREVGGENANPQFGVQVPTEGLHVTNVDNGGITLINTSSVVVGWAESEIEAFGNRTDTAYEEETLVSKSSEVWIFPEGEAFGNVTLGTA